MKAKLSSMVLVLTVFFVISKISYGCSNPLPTVYITCPTNGAAFTQGENITVKAVASDDGYVTKVRFYVYQNGQQLYSYDCDAPPYEHTWSGLTAGSYELKAKARDNLGAWSGFSTVSVTVGQIRYVDTTATGNNNGTSWRNAFKYLQNALTVSSAGDDIRVAQGTYWPDTNTAHPNGTNVRTATFQLKSFVDVKGGYAGYGEPDPNARDTVAYKTILSGDINRPKDPNDNSYHVVKGANAVMLDGFTITGGNADGQGANSYGGGMYNNGSSSIIVINCAFSGNQAYDGGGIYNSSCSPTVTNCVFTENDANRGGGMYDCNSCPRLTNCTFSGNSAADHGGGIYNYHSYPAIINCIIWGNTAASNKSICNNNGSYNPNNDPCLVSWWKFDESSESTAYDTKVHYNGTVTGATWTPWGEINRALRFDANEDYVYIPGLTPRNKGTFAAWAKSNVNINNSTPARYNTLIYSYRAQIFLGNAISGHEGSAYFVMSPSVGQYSQLYSNKNSWNANEWYHITCTWDGTTQAVYVNGLLDKSQTQTYSGGWGATYIGGVSGVPSYSFDGIIDDVHVYYKALSGEEVRSLSGVIRYSDIEGCGGSPPSGTWNSYFGTDGGGNIDSDPKFTDANEPAGPDGVFGTMDDGLQLQTNSPCIDAGDPNYDSNNIGMVDLCGNNRFMDGNHDGENIVDMGAYELPTIWYVDGDVQDGNGFSWTTADGNLRGVLAAAHSGDEIWVAEGTYKPTTGINRSISFELVEGVKVYGGFAGTEVARCQRNLRVNRTILSGDIGQPNDPNDNSYHVVKGADGAVLDGFTITGGKANGSGTNRYGGGMYNNGSSPIVVNCILSGNHAYYYGGGIYNSSCSPTITNCVFSENNANRGGGVYDCNSSPTITNCTLSKNFATADGGGIYNYASSTPTVTNCILWGNTDSGTNIVSAQIYGGAPDVTYSCIQDDNPNDVSIPFGGAGNKNIDDNPRFVNANNPSGLDGIIGTWDDGLRLKGTSPCIDAANGDVAPLTDILGLARVDVNYVNNTGAGDPNYVDMGAYESYSGYGSDSDGDGLWDYEEYLLGTDPNNPDSDNDGLSDGDEFNKFHTNPLSPDTDGDGLSDGDEINKFHTNPLSVDTDGDGMPDGWEVFYHHCNPLVDDANTDSDGDGLTNKQEYDAGTNPDNNDTDGDGMSDKWEHDHNLNPLDASDIYGDPDGDHYENILEFRHKPNPTNPNNSNDKPDYILVPNDYNSIQQAINEAVDGNIIVVKPGTYTEELYIGNKSITLQSINPLDPKIVAATIITAISGNNVIELNDSNSNISGFTIKGGKHGIYCHGSSFSSPEVTHCVISGNWDRGIKIEGSAPGATPKVDNCTFSNNGGGIYNSYSGTTVTNCVFKENKFDGEEYDEGGGGAYIKFSEGVTIENCFFVGNEASYGGGIYNYTSSLTLKNCVFSGNTSSGGVLGGRGGAIFLYAFYGKALIEAYNCTFNGNTAADNEQGGTIYGGQGGAIYQNAIFGQDSNSFIAYNCILWDNNSTKGHEIYNNTSSNDAVFNYCDIDNSPNYAYIASGSKITEANCIYLDPLFVCPSLPAGPDGIYYTEDDGLRIQPSSPCVDAGRYSLIIPPPPPDPNQKYCYVYSDGCYEYISRVQVGNIDNITGCDSYTDYTAISTYMEVNQPYSITVTSDGWRDPCDECGIWVDWNHNFDFNDPGETITVNGSPGEGPYYTATIKPPAGAISGNTRLRIRLSYEGCNNYGECAPPLAPCGSIVGWGSEWEDYTINVIGGIVPKGNKIVIKPYDITGQEPVDIPYVDDNGVGDLNYADIGAYEVSPIIWHVKESAAGSANGSSWNNAMYLQDALAKARQYGGEIWVAAGTYKPDCNSANPNGTGDRNSSFELVDGVGIYGGFSGSETIRSLRDWTLNKTRLSGDINGSANSHHVVTSISNRATAILDGFTITDGDANGSGVDSYGGGILCYVTSPTIRNCVITGNKAVTGGGGAILYEGLVSSVTVKNCTFSGNEANDGGGMYNSNSSPEFANCVFSDNNAPSGGGIYNSSGSPEFMNCVFCYNNAPSGSGGGMYNGNSDSPIVTNCVFSYNQAGKGGGMSNYASSTPTITNCVFVGNEGTGISGADGAAMYNENCRPILINCTFTKNVATVTGGIYNASLLSGSSATNCILWADTGSLPEVSGPGRMTFSYCDIEGCGSSSKWNYSLGINGGGNIEVNPYFMDANNPAGPDGIYRTADDGLRLCVLDSPLGSCLDAADSTVAPDKDITGRGRTDIRYIPNTGKGIIKYTDIGAYESPTVWYVDSTNNYSRGQGWSWDFALDDLQDAIEKAVPGDEIWVAAGEYKPGSKRSDTFYLNKAIAIYGGFAGNEYNLYHRNWSMNKTILSGEIGDEEDVEDNCYHVVKIECNSVILDGFTITGGYADESNNEPNHIGGGIYINNSSPRIANCIITENFAYFYGGGMYVDSGAPTVTNCIFRDNKVLEGSPDDIGFGGGMYNKDASPIVTSCIFNGNYAKEGGGMYNTNSSPTLISCIFRENTAHCDGGGIANKDNSFLVATNCIFNANKSSGLVSAIYSLGYSVMLNNCTFTSNETETQGSSRTVVYLSDYQDHFSTVTNSIFWLNKVSQYQIEIGSASNPFIRYCDIEGGTAGIHAGGDYGTYQDGRNIISGDPHFVEKPEFYDETIKAGWLDAIIVAEANKYSFGDIIQYGNDVNAKTVTYVDYDNDIVVFDPPLDEASEELIEIKNWGKYAIIGHGSAGYNDPFKIQSKIMRLKLNSTPSLSSPCIDAGLDDGVPWDTLDLDGDGRTTTEKIPYDIMGVLRLQNINGGPNSVDMGALECGGLIASDKLNVQVVEDTPKIIKLDMQDLKGGSPTYVIINAPKHGTLSSGSSDVNIIYTPAKDYNCDSNCDEFYYKAYDGINYSEIARVTISEVNSVNDPPVAVDDEIWINDGEVNGILINVLANDSDPEKDTLTITANYNGNYGYTSVVSGKIKYTVTNWNGLASAGYDTFDYQICDSNTPAPGRCDTATVTVKLNHRPIAVDDPNIVTEPKIIKVIDVLANDTDQDGHSLSIVDLQGPPADQGKVGKVVIYKHHERGDMLVYCPNSHSSVGDYNFTYKAKDEWGLKSANAATVTVNVRNTAVIVDSDGDGISDIDEAFFGTNPKKFDTDGDGIWDGDEIMAGPGYDPTNSNSSGYYANPLPYITCFQTNQGYTADGASLDGQKGWKVNSGTCTLDFMYIAGDIPPWGCITASLSPGAKISKEFTDNGAADDYSNVILARLYPTDGAIVRVLSGEKIIAAAKFVAGGSNYIYYWSHSQNDWKKSGQRWRAWEGYPDYSEHSYSMALKFESDFNTKKCKLLWDPCSNEDCNFVEVNEVEFDNDINSITKIEFENSGTEEFKVRGLYINETVASSSCQIENPNDGDDVQESRIPVKGWCCSPYMSGYMLWWIKNEKNDTNYYYEAFYSSSDTVVNRFDDRNILGYWNTGALPKGVYHLEIAVFDDLCLAYSGYPPCYQTDYGNVIYQYQHCHVISNVATSGVVRSTTFHHVEEPDISVPWPGQFPFELKRIYDSGRYFIEHPFYPGWTNNNQIILTEDAHYYESSADPNGKTAKGNPADSDASGLAFGAIYVQYEDGSMHLFRHTTGSTNGNEAIYVAYPDDGSGDYVKRTTSGSVPCFEVVDDELSIGENDLNVNYQLYRRDGTRIVFHDVVSPDVISVPWKYELCVDYDCSYRDPCEVWVWRNYPTANYLPSGGAVWKSSGTSWPDFDPWDKEIRFYPPKEKWCFTTAVKTKSDRFGNTLHFEWNENEYNPAVTKIDYDYDGDGIEEDTKISIELTRDTSLYENEHFWGCYNHAELKVDGEVKRIVDFQSAITEDGEDAFQVCKRDVGTTDEKDYTSYVYWAGAEGFLAGIFNDKLELYLIEGYSLCSLPPLSACSTFIAYDSGDSFSERVDFVDEDNYLYRYYWYFFFEPDSGNNEDGQCVFNAVDYYNSNYMMLPYKMDVTVINEKGQLRVKYPNISSSSLPKWTNCRYDNRLPFTPTEMVEHWYDFNCLGKGDFPLFHGGRVILNDYEKRTLDFSDVNNPDVNCYDLKAQSIYHMTYDSNGILLDDTPYVQNMMASTEMGYHAYAGYALETNSLSYQKLNPTEPNERPVKTEYVYGLHDGNTSPNNWEKNTYLIQEKVLVDDKGTSEEGDDEWAITRYEYNHKTCEGDHDTNHNPPHWGDAYALTKKTDPCGVVTLYEYDDKHQKQWVKIGMEGDEVPVERYCYDAIGQMQLKADTYGLVTLYDYDGFGDVVKVRTFYDPDALNKLNSFTPADYEARTPRSTTVYGYDYQRRRISEKTFPEEKGSDQVAVKRTEYASASNKPKKIIFDKDSDSNTSDSYVVYTYDGQGVKIKEENHDVDAAAPRSWWSKSYWYDSMDRLVWTDWYGYGDASLLKSSAAFYHGSGKDAYKAVYGYDGGVWKCNRTDYKYDALDRLKDVIASFELDANDLPKEYSITSYGYDDVGNQISVTDPNGSIIYTSYDNANRKIADYFAAEPNTQKSNAVVRRETKYYGNNLVKSIKDYDYQANGSNVLAYKEFGYDERSRLTEVSEAIDDGNYAVTTYAYQDANDSTFWIGGSKYASVTIIDPCNKETRIAYNEQGKMIETIYPSDSNQQLVYNGDGTLKKKVVFDANNTQRWIEYYYDPLARLTDVNYPDGGNVHYNYDGFGRMTQFTDSRNSSDKIGGTGAYANKIKYEYDPLDRIIDVNDQDGYHIKYSYRGDDQKHAVVVTKPDQTEIYRMEYLYDAAGRLLTVTEPPLGGDDYIAQFQYDKNGNRKKLQYYKTGSPIGPTVSIDYTYNLDNHLTGFATTGGPTFTLNNVTVDGLGRLKGANETITKTDSSTISHGYIFAYDMRSQLTDANISNINSGNWVAKYSYHDNGDMAYRTIQSDSQSFFYNGNLMTNADGNALDYDENGNMIENASAKSLKYNWDNKLRCAKSGSYVLLALKYDPSGNRIYKETTNGAIKRKCIVDVVGDLPVILLEIDDSNDVIQKTYIYANAQILAEHNGNYSTPRYFYLHDRLGSVRQIIDTSGLVKNTYTYEPFGKLFATETTENITNPFKFSGQFFDDEIDEYYLRARQYDPYISRFTSRDPIFGQFQEPLTLHAYLYCLNNPINRIDPTGLWGSGIHNQIIDEAFSSTLGENLRRQMYKGSAWVDKLPRQTSENAYMHAMTNAKTNQSVDEAKEQMWGFVWGNYCLYKQYKNLGKEGLAYNYLGRAMHPIMDWTCPTHNWQEWKLTKEEVAAHKLAEPTTIKSTTLRDTVSRIHDVMRQYDEYYELSQILMLALY